MKKKFTNMESRGLPGGPNEMFTYTTGVFSTEGYRDDSPDRHNLFNIINSSDISMEGVGGPVLGIDTFGNKQMMYPGGEYKFQGDKVFEIPMFEHGGPHDPDDPPSKIITTDQHLAELKAAYEAEAARAREVMENAHALGLKLATNEENQDTQLQVAKGFRTQVTDDGYDLAPREILISNAQDWEEIGMGFINDPKHWINNLITKDPMTGKTMYVQRPSSIRTDEYGNRKWVNVRDEDGNLIPRRKRGQGCIGAMCGIFSTAGATQVEDYSTGTGKTTKAGDPIFKQMSNAFWDANNEAALRAAGFEKVKEGDPITEGTLARNRNIDAKGNPYHSHTAMVNVVNEDGTAVDFTDLQGFIENPGGLSMGITTSKPYKGYDLEYYNYVGKSPALKKEYEDFLAKVEELRGFDDIERLPLVKSELSKRETSSGIPKIIRREESDKPKRNKFFANKRIKRHGGPHDPLSPEYLKSEGFANAVNQDLDSLLKGWNTDGYDSHWYKGNAESYGVTADQLREFAAKNHPKSFVNAAAYTQAMNKLANDAGAPNVSNIPFAYNPMVMRTADDDIEYVEYEKPTTLQEEGYIDETGTKAVNLDKDYKTGLAKRYGRNRYDHLVEEKDGGSTLELGNIDPKSRYGQWIKRKVDSGKYIYDSEKDELILKKLHEGGEPGHTHRKKHAWRDVQPSESNPEYKKDMYTAYLDGDITKKEYEDHLLKEQIKAYYGESKPSEKEIKRLQHPMNLSTPRKLQFGEPGFKEQQERNRGDAAGLVEDFGKGVAHTADEFFVQPVVRTYDKVTTDPLQFAKDIGNTFIDAATYPQELLYEGADSLFGFDDGSFNMEGKANLLGNPYGSGVGTTLDAALTIPIVKGTTSLISPAFKTARRELMYHGVNPVDYKPFKKILRMPRTLLENAIDPAGRPARLFGANKMKDPRHVENVTRMGERRLDAWAEYLGKNQKYNTFDKFADGRYALKDEFAINPKGRGFKHNRTVNNNLVQNELVADAYTQQADDLLKAGTINEAQHEKLLQEIYDVSIQDGSKSRITISNAFKNKLYKDMPEKANITREPLKSYERKRIVQPSTSKEYDYTIYDWDYSGVRGGMSYNVKLPEKNLITDFLKKNNLKGGVQTTEGLPGGPNQYKSNNFIIESHDIWDLMPFTRRNPRVYVNDAVQRLKPRLLDDFEIGPLIGGKPLNITNRQVFDRNLRLLNEAPVETFSTDWVKDLLYKERVAPPKLQGGGWLSNFIRKHTPSFDFTYGRRGMQDPTMGPNLRFGSIYGDTRDSGNYLDLGLNLGYAVNANLDPYRSNFPLTGGVDATYVGPKMGRAFRAAVTGGVDWSPYMGTTAYFGFAPQFEAGKKLDEKLRRPAGRNVFKKFFDPRSYSLQTRPLGFFGGMRARPQNIGIEGNPPPTVSGELVGDPFTNAYTWTPFDYNQAIAQQPDFNAWEAITEDGGSGIGGPMWGFMGDLSFRKRLGDNLSAILRAGYTADFIKGKAQEEWGNQSFMGPDGVTAYTQGSSGDDKVKLAFDPRFQIGLTYTPDHRRYRGRSKQIRDRKIREDKIIQDVIEKNSSVEEETEPKTMSRHPRWLKDGGQHLDGYKIYKDFVNGAYDNTDDYVSAEAIYDKLNRIHYEDAKNANMSPANYIMTNIINA